MKVVSSAVSHGKGGSFSVELDVSDVVPSTISQEHWDSLSLQGKHRAMMQEADMMVVRYLWESNIISGDYAAQRIAEICARSGKPGV